MLPVIYKLDKEYSLRLGFRGIAKLEKIFNQNVDKWKLKELSFDQYAAILAEALRREVSDITSEKVMELIDDFSDINTAIKKVFECINETFGKNGEAVEEKQEQNQQNQTPPQTTILN